MHNNNPTMGLIKRSYLGGFLVNPSPTYVTLVTILFHAFSREMWELGVCVCGGGDTKGVSQWADTS